jgi:hypothetical protein
MWSMNARTRWYGAVAQGEQPDVASELILDRPHALQLRVSVAIETRQEVHTDPRGDGLPHDQQLTSTRIVSLALGARFASQRSSQIIWRRSSQ